MPRIVRCGCGQEVGVIEDRIGARGNCVWCGVELVVRPDNSKEVPALGVTAPRMETDALPEAWTTSSASHCSRCKQPFRGDWDRNVTDEGVLCHRCKNLWRPPKTKEPYIVPSPPVRELDSDFNPLPLVTAGSRSLADAFDDGFGQRFDKKSAEARGTWWLRHQGKLYYLAFAVVAVLVVTVLPLNQLIAFVFANEAARANVPLPVAAGTLLLLVRVVCAVLKVFVPLYAGLHAVDALPNDTLRKNLVAVGAVSAGLSILGLASFLPLYGALAFIVQLVLIMYIYDMDTRPFGKFLLVFLVLSLVMFPVSRLVVGGTYGLLAGLSS